MTITSYGYDGTVGEVAWSLLSPFHGQRFAVGTAAGGVLGLALSVGGTGDRAVTIGTGTAYGDGVYDVNDATVNLTASSVGSGSRWDTVVIARSWSGTNGTTTLAVRTGTATKAVAGGLANTPGTSVDQPLFLIRAESGQTDIQEYVDLRASAGKIRSFASAVGLSLTAPTLGEWAYAIDTGHLWHAEYASGQTTWVNTTSRPWTNFTLASGITAGSFGYPPSWRLHQGKIELRGIAQRTSGAFTGTGTTIATLPPRGGGPSRRPSVSREYAARVNFQAANCTGSIDIGSDGVIKGLAPTTNVTHTWISLDDISFEPDGN